MSFLLEASPYFYNEYVDFFTKDRVFLVILVTTRYVRLLIGLMGVVGIVGVATAPFVGKVIDGLLPWVGVLAALAFAAVGMAIETAAGGISVSPPPIWVTLVPTSPSKLDCRRCVLHYLYVFSGCLSLSVRILIDCVLVVDLALQTGQVSHARRVYLRESDKFFSLVRGDFLIVALISLHPTARARLKSVMLRTNSKWKV